MNTPLLPDFNVGRKLQRTYIYVTDSLVCDSPILPSPCGNVYIDQYNCSRENRLLFKTGRILHKSLSVKLTILTRRGVRTRGLSPVLNRHSSIIYTKMVLVSEIGRGTGGVFGIYRQQFSVPYISQAVKPLMKRRNILPSKTKCTVQSHLSGQREE